MKDIRNLIVDTETIFVALQSMKTAASQVVYGSCEQWRFLSKLVDSWTVRYNEKINETCTS